MKKILFLLLLPLFLLAEETMYKIDKCDFEYFDNDDKFPTQEKLESINIDLKRIDNGYTICRKGDKNKITVTIKHIGNLENNYFTKDVINNIANKALNEINKEGFAGVSVFVDPKQIDKFGNDLRQNGNLTFRIKVKKIKSVHTHANNEKIKEDQRINHPKHQRHLKNSPVQADSHFHKKDVDNYVHKLNRHPTRNVRAIIKEDDEGEELILKYMIKEQKPWILYVSAMNTGTYQTRKWQEVAGYINTQFTGHDDTLTLAYFTASFKNVWAITGSYQFPLPKDWYIRLTGLYNDFNASLFGLLGQEVINKETGAIFEFGNTFYQNKNLFVDIFVSTRYRYISINNQLALYQAHENFLVPEGGIRLERLSSLMDLRGTFTIGGNMPGIVGTNESKLIAFGSQSLDKDYKFMRLRWYSSYFLPHRPKTFPKNKNYFNPHQIIFICNGQYGFNYRLIPQERVVYGGLFTVRGYPELITPGDTGINSTIQYQYHFGRTHANKMAHIKNQLPNWDVILSVFTDVGATVIDRKKVNERDQFLWGTGLGGEVKIGRNFLIHAQWGLPLVPFLDAFDSSFDVKRFKSRFHMNGTLLF